jgi:uncharacterized membrane protein YgcG
VAKRFALLSALLALLLLGWSAAIAVAVGPPFGERPAGTAIVDDADVFRAPAQASLDQTIRELSSTTGVDIVVYTQTKRAARSIADARADARALLDQWSVGANGEGVVLLWDFNQQNARALVALAATPALMDRVGQEALNEVVTDAMATPLDAGDWLTALTNGVVSLSMALSTTAPQTPPPTLRPEDTPGPEPTPGPVEPPVLEPAPPGPPYPDPIPDVTVYDYAGVLSRDTIMSVTQQIAAIEARTGAEVVVYSQVKPSADTPAEAEADAVALIDQWGVGRAGFDDGMAILLDLDDSRCHGQVQLYAAPGFAGSYLTNDERQRIFEEEMLPHLRGCDFDAALLAAMARIDASATADHARTLQLARQIDAATGLVVAPLAVLGLVGWAGWSWVRFGRDPEVLDDPSIHMPAPPPGLTPAAAAVVLDGRATRHALTTAMTDLASRGELRFREAGGLLQHRVDVEVMRPDELDPRQVRARRVPLGAAEELALERLQALADSRGRITADELPKYARDVAAFDQLIEDHVTRQGWFREPPERSTERWSFRAGIVLVLGILGAVVATILPSSGLLLLGGGLIAASIVMFVLARVMPQRTLAGAMVHAWLAAYRRTLQKTFQQSRSMDEVVSSRAVPWLETADQAVVWGIGLGLHEEVEDVLERSLEQARAGGAAPGIYLPAWYLASTGGGGAGGRAGIAPGLAASSVIPDFGAMTAALSTIGAPPPSSGGGSGSGGFSGGGSGGGGGGAGGGF